MADAYFLFTSEAVCEGHPGWFCFWGVRLCSLADKVCDQVSDAVLDACVKDDESAKVACECCVKTGMIMIFGEITTSATINYEAVVRETLKEIGYDDPIKGLDYKSVNVIVAIEEQSPEIARSVDAARLEDIGAGDQGVVFGYATDEADASLMPLSHLLASNLALRLTEVRKARILDWAQPDGKAQVTCEYRMDKCVISPQRVRTVVISAQHTDTASDEQIREGLMEQVIHVVIPEKFTDSDTVYHVNPSGRFIIGGPHADAGVTGRKIIADTYGGWGSHGGGAFSGKDATKMDRSGAYAARWVAKSLVQAHLCHRVSIQLAFAIGVPYPVSIYVNSYGTALILSGKSDAELVEVVRSNFDLRPGCIVRDLKLRRPLMLVTAKHGHFGHDVEPCTWEKPKQLVT